MLYLKVLQGIPKSILAERKIAVFDTEHEKAAKVTMKMETSCRYEKEIDNEDKLSKEHCFRVYTSWKIRILSKIENSN